ncbi:putative pyramid forming protein [Saccharolobus solfataricus rod-shaped virus 1]|uniref:Putative pyramid forming protein n=1 Tax=Saccharolobus solfataricus rod-shaped virus 1 TaxID=2730619 RepID=A0A6M3VXF1_SSRV1|nr:putative pyramid forming protein [Saccharolobus solfataricus rod-shaped virus 1]QJF12297.1 putative pyramid forming protein [Saccharolobus solfataricus rod-shaped virus 1]
MSLTGLEQIVLIGFLAVVGALVIGFVISEIAYIFNNRQATEAFTNAMQQMSQTTVVAVESVKETTITAINSIAGMAGLNDVNSLAHEKVKQNSQSQQK